MTDRAQALVLDQEQIIQDHPIGKGLDVFRALFESTCQSKSISCDMEDALDQLRQHCSDLRDLAYSLLSIVSVLPITLRLSSSTGRGTLRSELSRLSSSFTPDHSDNLDFDQIIPLFHAVLANKPDDEIWRQVYCAVTEATPPPRPTASSLSQTPWHASTSSLANSSEYRKDFDRALKDELGTIYVDIPGFRDIFFGRVAGLETASEAVFNKCMEGSEPLYRNGWSGWPTDAHQDRVLNWFAEMSRKLATIAEEYNPTPTWQRRTLGQPNKPILGSTAERKLDVGFVDDPKAGMETRCRWSHILIPGELKSNPSADKASKTWLDLGRYAREVFSAEDTLDSRRFVLGFTICGSLMRLWEFDRLGAIASEQFNINKDGLQFVSTVLAFLWMSKEELGFDPSIMTENDERFIQIERNGSTERLVIDKVMLRARCISGRATTCWKAHREGDPQTPLVIKDSWQYTDRDEEGELLRDATSHEVVNVARYYHHETVQVRGTEDEIQSNVRGGTDVTTATNYRPEHSTLPNRVHRRVILRDYGEPIYKASSRAALLAALGGCIQGHESLWQTAGLLHRDISIHNLMINEDDDNPSWPSFLIDLDLAVRREREGVSGARGKTGTRAFMAIGVLQGEHHSFMHDLESFFWVLFWICVHYDGPGKSKVVPKFDQWNYLAMDEVADMKTALVLHERDFLRSAGEKFTPYYQPLIPWVNRLRRVVFPNGLRWENADMGLYTKMRKIIEEARNDPEVLTERHL